MTKYLKYLFRERLSETFGGRDLDQPTKDLGFAVIVEFLEQSEFMLKLDMPGHRAELLDRVVYIVEAVGITFEELRSVLKAKLLEQVLRLALANISEGGSWENCARILLDYLHCSLLHKNKGKDGGEIEEPSVKSVGAHLHRYVLSGAIQSAETEYYIIQRLLYYYLSPAINYERSLSLIDRITRLHSDRPGLSRLEDLFIETFKDYEGFSYSKRIHPNVLPSIDTPVSELISAFEVTDDQETRQRIIEISRRKAECDKTPLWERVTLSDFIRENKPSAIPLDTSTLSETEDTHEQRSLFADMDALSYLSFEPGNLLRSAENQFAPGARVYSWSQISVDTMLCMSEIMPVEEILSDKKANNALYNQLSFIVMQPEDPTKWKLLADWVVAEHDSIQSYDFLLAELLGASMRAGHSSQFMQFLTSLEASSAIRFEHRQKVSLILYFVRQIVGKGTEKVILKEAPDASFLRRVFSMLSQCPEGLGSLEAAALSLTSQHSPEVFKVICDLRGHSVVPELECSEDVGRMILGEIGRALIKENRSSLMYNLIHTPRDVSDFSSAILLSIERLSRESLSTCFGILSQEFKEADGGYTNYVVSLQFLGFFPNTEFYLDMKKFRFSQAQRFLFDHFLLTRLAREFSRQKRFLELRIIEAIIADKKGNLFNDKGVRRKHIESVQRKFLIHISNSGWLGSESKCEV